MNATLSFTYSGESGFVTIQWFHDGVLIDNGTFGGVTIEGADTDTLVIENIDCDWDGEYYAVVTDAAGCVAQTEPYNLALCECVTQFYYNFENYFILPGSTPAYYFENLPDNQAKYCIGLFTHNPGGIVAGKIGNAMFNSSGDARSIGTSALDCFNFTNRSFTIRFWFKGGVSQILAIGDGGSLPSIYIRWLGTGPNMFQLELYNATTGMYVNFFTSPAITDPNDWHRFVMSYDNDTFTGSVKVDNEAYVSTVVPGFVLRDTPGFIQIVGGSYIFTIDELAVLPDVVWDEADATYDWNGGTGRTWPDLPT